MRPTPARALVGSLLLLGVAIYATHTGTWRALSTALGIGNPDAVVTVPTVPDPDDVLPSSVPKVSDLPDPGDLAAKIKGLINPGGAAAALAVLDTLDVKGKAAKTGYARAEFGSAWADIDHNGCDTRNDILARDLTNITYTSAKSSCQIATGTLADPYTAKTIRFVRGQATSTAVQIDHLVALSNAWVTGAQKLSVTDRERFANDPDNLLAVDGPTNAAKGDGDAATWLPPNKAYRCTYVSKQVGVKARYHLWVTAAEKEAIARVLASCAKGQA